MSETCPVGVENKEKIKALEARQTKEEVENSKKFDEIFGTLKEIRDHLLQRPSWAVTVVITLLSSVCVGLIVRMVNG